MTQKPRKEDFRKLKSKKKFPFTFGASSGSTWKLGNRSVFIDPSLHVNSLSISDVKYYLTSLTKCFKIIHVLKTSRLEVKDIFYFWKYVRTSKHVYPGPRGFSWFFFAKEIKSKPRSGDNELRKRRGEREKPLVTLASNLTFMQTTGSGSDPRALIGW